MRWIKFIKYHILSLVPILFLGLILSQNLLEVPRGLTVDEAAFGLNATLLANTGRDENGRFMPVFVLSIGGKDWRQPVTQYYQTLFFKIFGPGVYNLRFSSITITLFSSLALYFFIYELTQSKWYSILGELLFLTSPIVAIQARMGLDNNVPVIFTLIWLIFLHKVITNKNSRHVPFFLMLMAISLGLSFYSYKGMRIAVPVWTIITGVYLLIRLKSLKLALMFWIFISPFYIIIPYLNYKYPGSILGGTSPNFDGIYNFVYPYLSYFDPSFLFVRGDATPYHSTGKHGMLLLSTLPAIILGTISFIQKKHWIHLVLLASAPILMGTVGSVHRASRIMCTLPFYILLMVEGIKYLKNFKTGFLLQGVLILLTLFNFMDFWNYYQSDYAKVTEESFGNLKYYQAYARLKHVSESYGVSSYVSKDVVHIGGESGKFFETVYFRQFLPKIEKEEGTIGAILSLRDQIDDYKNMGCDGERIRLCVQLSNN